MSNPPVPHGPSGEVPLTVWDTTNHQLVPVQGVSATQDSTGQWYAVLNVNASFSASSLAINDPTTTTQKMAVDASGNASVKLGAALPAGTNVIGHVIVDSAGSVSITSLPSLSAGSANIGSVEILDSAGTNKLAVDASGRITLVPNSSINAAQVAGTTTSVNQGTIDAGTQRFAQGGAATGTKSNVAGSASSVTILASNTSRKGAMVYNDSTAILYLDLSGGVASTTSYSV